MNLEQYQTQKNLIASHAPKLRTLCGSCVQPEFSCYCSLIKPFDCKVEFVILIHPIEVRRRIATGRMSHLCLKNSHLISGQDYSQNMYVNSLIADPGYHSVILYPGADSCDVSRLTPSERASEFPVGKKLRVFVIDGTWATAKKMVKQSQNLQQLPKICFTPEAPSTFRVRKQPGVHCYSTIEAIHQTIELLGKSQGFDTDLRQQDNLLEVFNHMVERQLQFSRDACDRPQGQNYRPHQKIA